MNPATLLVNKASLEISRGQPAVARQYAADLESMAEQRSIDGLLVAGVYARIGDIDRAFDVLAAAYTRKDNTLLSIATSPVVDNLRSDPRYTAWLRRLHFTDQIMQRMEFKSSSANRSLRQPQ